MLALILFVTVKLDKVPSCVMLAWAPEDKAPLKVPACTVPVTDKLFKPARFVIFAVDALITPADTVPVTDKLPN